MVDAVVSYAVEKLGDFLIQRIELRLSIRDNIEWLRNELHFMQSFLDDADQKQTTDSLVKQWVCEIRDLAHDTVDILDEFIINSDGEAPKPGIVARLKSYACICSKEVDLYGIINNIESLKERVLDLSRKRETYGIKNINDAGEGTSSIGRPTNRSNMRIRRKSTSYFEEERFFGFKDVTEMLIKELLKEEDSRNVISIHGTGGLGKTTLAKKLYNSVDVQQRFACRAWVCVSKEYSIKDLLQTVVKSFKKCSKEDLEKLALMNEEDLERDICEFLNGNRYLIVVDDVWRKEDWESLKRAFPDGHNGSRVIITTRIEEVAERVGDRSFINHLRFLRPEESWDLFTNEISRNGHHHRLSPAMQQMGEEMVEKCSGLPLAIVVLGGLLSNKTKVEEWRRVKDQLWQHMKKDSIDISHMLFLSYNDLSSALKRCFLYIGIFPEDTVIDPEKLMRLWMAEGFVSQVDKMEDIAEDYLHELINRNLIQVNGRYLGKIERCKIHDLLRDLAVEKAREVNLFDIYNPRVHDGGHSCRRLTIDTQTETFFSDGISSGKLRSLLFFNPDLQCPDTGNSLIACHKLKFLCVLDLFNVSFMNSSENSPLPDAIGDLILLKFLGLRFDYTLIQLPSTIGKLTRLQTLVVTSGGYYSLPAEICNLINMRYLDVNNSEGQLNINTMRNLRALRYLDYEQWMDIDSVNLVHLRELFVAKVTPITGKPYSLDSVSKLKNLTSLQLFTPWNDYSYLPSLEPLFSCSSLLRLHLCGKIEKLPSIDNFPQTLTNLILQGSQLSEDPMPTLEKLLDLGTLELYENAYDGKEITCADNGFVQLEHLVLEDLRNLEKWILPETTMPMIGSLRITNCSKLKNVPERLKSIMM